MDARFTVAQVTGALPNNEPAKVFKLTKPQTDQAITVHLDGTSKLDLTAIGNENVTFVHAGDRLVILFDNHSTVTIEPFYDSKGLPLPDISVELSPDRNVSGVEFASLFPITTDQSILPAAGGTSSPGSGANFETVNIDQFANNPVPLALLGPEAPAGNGGPTNSIITVAVNPQTQGPALGVHDVAGNEDRPIALGITDALSIADPRASLGSLTVTGVPAGATLSAGIHNADGSWTLTPAQLAGLTLTSDGEVQHFALTVRGTTIDGGITDVSTATFNVSVTPVADTPTLALAGGGLAATVSGNEDKAIALPIQTALGEADTDAVLSVTITGVPAGAILSAGIHNADGSWTLMPAQLSGLTLTSDGEAQHFDLKVTATTTDGGDAATAASTSGTLHVDVTPVPETPTLATIVTPASINEGTAIALNLVPHFEVDADAINTIVVSGLPSGATLNHGTFDPSTGTYTLSQADLAGLTLTAPDNDTKQISFTVTAHASEGGIDAASSTQQVTLAVNPVAEAPVLTATAAAASVNEDSTVALNINVTAESDADATTSVTISGLGTATLTNAAGGTFSGDTVTFTQAQLNAGALNGLTLHAADDDTASLHLTVTASTNDAGNIATSAPQTINLTVNPVAEAPVLTATAAAGSVNEDSTVALSIAVAPAESDADATTSVTISGLGTATLTNAAGGTFSGDTVTFTQAQLNAGALNGLTLHAADDDTASLHLTVTASTNDAGNIATSAPQTINLTVNPVADAPVLTATAAAASVNEDSTVALNINVTAESDADATTSVTISGLGTATLTNAAGGTFSGDTVTFTQAQLNAGALNGLTLHAADDDTASLHLTVTASTNDAGNIATSAPQTINLTVNPVADAPALTATAAAASVNEDSTVALNINVTPVSEPGDNDTFTSVTISGLGTATLNHGTVNLDGSVTLQLSDLTGLTLHAADDDTSQLNLTVTATTFDGTRSNASTTETIDLAVNPVPDVSFIAPVLTASADANGNPVGNSTSSIAIDGNGAEVAFDVSSDHFTSAQVFAKNLQTGTLTLVSADANGNAAVEVVGNTTVAALSEGVSIDGDGQLVTFQSDATNLAPNLSANPPGTFEIFVKNVATGQVTLASADATGAPLAGGSFNATISTDGTSVTFQNGSEVFQKNLVTGSLTLVSADAHGNAANGGSVATSSVSSNGNIVAFASTATNLATNATSGQEEIFVKNLATGAVTLVSANANGAEANAASGGLAAISADGRFVVFESSATNLTANATDGKQEIFVKDLQTGNVVLASANANGVEASIGFDGFSISADGRFVTFATNSPNLISQPTAGQLEIVTKDLLTGAVTLVSTDANGIAGNSDSLIPVISADGRVVAAITTASNLGGSSSNEQIFVKAPNVAFGAENKPIAIPLQLEVDPDAATTVTLSGIPSGVTLSNAANNIPPIVNGSVTLTQAQLAGLALTSDGEVQAFDLVVSGTDGGVTAVAATVHVEVAPVPVAPILTVTLPAPAFTTIDASIPGTTVTSTQVTGINDAGHLVGLFKDASGITHAFEDINGTFTSLPLTSAPSSNTIAVGININDQIVGNTGGTNAFIDTNGSIATFTDNNNVTLATGINDSGEIVGIVSSGGIHGFQDINGNFTQIDGPKTFGVAPILTEAFGINNSGEIVGFFQDVTGKFHGFTDIHNTITPFDVVINGVTAASTKAFGVNNAGEIVGFFTDASGHTHGFLDNNGHFTQIDVPNATLTEALGINDANQIVGFYTDAKGVNHGFTLQEPHVSGNEDTAIALPIAASVASGESDPDAVLTVTINGLPSGVTLTDNNHDIITIVNGSATVTAAELNGLALISDGETQHFDLTVTATNTDGGDALTAISTPSQLIHVDVTPVADAPVLTIGATVSGNEDNAIALPIQAALGEADADAVLSLKISGVPAGATLSAGVHNADGSWTLTPAQLAGLTLTSDGETQHFDLTVTATTVDGGNTATAASASGTLHVNVTPVADAPVLTLTTSHVSGNEDQQIALGINAALGEIDKDAVLSVVISGLPAGVTLSDANGNVLPIAFGIIELTPAQLAGLTLTSDGEVQNFVLTVTATTVDGGNAATEALTSVGLQVDVTPVADAPTLTTSQLVFQPVAFDVSGALLTEALGVNAQGTIVGLFEDSTSAVHGFVDKGGGPAKFDAPASTLTEVTGINDNGDIVGVFFDKSSAEHGFLETSAGAFSQIDVMGASATLAFGINNSGTIVGRFVDASGHIHGFSEQEQNGVLIPGTFTQIDVSLAGDTTINATRALGINNNGQIVGLFDDGSGEHGFVDTNGVFEAIDVPGAAKTNARGIDANGDIVGVFDDALGEHGFFLSPSGVFTTINAGPGTFTDVLGVNASGSEVVGDFRDSAGTIHAFSATELQLLSNTVSGTENIPIALGINASLSEADADAAVTRITISGLPTGASLSDDNHDSLSIVNGSITLTPAELVGLALTSDGGDFDLTVTATTVDGGDNATAASSSTTLHVNVMSDPPTLFLPTSHVSGNEDRPIALAIIAALAEVDTDAVLTVTISGLPAGVSLNDLNGDSLTISSGSITLTPAELTGLTLTSDGEVQHFDLTVTATTVDGGNPTTAASSSGTLHIDVTPVADAPTFPTIPAFLFGPPITLAGQDVHATGINDAGTIVGFTEDHNSNSHVQGFILQPGGTPTIIDAPFAGVTATQLFGINAAGAIVGDATVGSTVEGFLDQGGTFTKIMVTGAAFTSASGINDAGVVVGEFIDGNGAHGFVDRAGVFTSIDVPGATFTQANGINNAGDIVGTFVDAMGGEHGFLDHNSVFTTIDVPGALFTQALGINNSGAIVGFYEDGNRLFHGFLDQGGVFTTIDASNSGFTEAFGINDAGMVAGVVGTSTAFDGFRATLNAFGAEDTPIALNIPTPTLSEPDPDAVLTVSISGVPAGATLNHGTITATGANGVTTWSVDPADLATLTLTSDGETTSFNLSVTATVTDGGDAATAASVTQTLHVGVTLDTASVAAQFDAVHNVLNFNNNTVTPNLIGETVELTDAGHPGATLNASGNQFTAGAANETLDLSGWDRAVEIDFAAGTIRLDANSVSQSGSISGFANIVGTTHNDSFDNLAGSVTVTGGSGAVDHFGLAANVLSSSSIPTITNYSSSSGETIDLSALLDAKFGPGSDPTKAANFVEVKEDAGGNSATLEININGTPGGTFLAAAHLGGVHSGDVVTAILDHVHTTAQLHAA